MAGAGLAVDARSAESVGPFCPGVPTPRSLTGESPPGRKLLSQRLNSGCRDLDPTKIGLQLEEGVIGQQWSVRSPSRLSFVSSRIRARRRACWESRKVWASRS